MKSITACTALRSSKFFLSSTPSGCSGNSRGWISERDIMQIKAVSNIGEWIHSYAVGKITTIACPVTQSGVKDDL